MDDKKFYSFKELSKKAQEKAVENYKMLLIHPDYNISEIYLKLREIYSRIKTPYDSRLIKDFEDEVKKFNKISKKIVSDCKKLSNIEIIKDLENYLFDDKGTIYINPPINDTSVL